MRPKNLLDKLKALKPKRGMCDHGPELWCQDCIARPELIAYKLPDGSISYGYYFTNKP